LNWIAQTFLIITIYAGSLFQSAAALLAADALPRSVSSESICEASLEALKQEEDWYERLIDPVLSNEFEIAHRLELYSEVHRCLEDVIERDTNELERLYMLTEYFLIFVGGYQTEEDGSELQLVDLAESDDPAVIRIREEAGLGPPPGYVYMRLYDSRQSMPPRLQSIFADRQAAGVTIFSRYIAVPMDGGVSIQDQILQQRTLPRTVSHELIHAYVHASLDPRDLGTLPEWFNEGVAIYFSGSGENHILVTPQAVAARTTTAEYLEYKEIFDYLESQLGKPKFQELIREAVELVEPSRIYEELGIEDEAQLRSLTQEWRGLRIRQGQIISLVSIIVLAAFVVWLVPPEVRCTCGYTGSRKKFVDGRCPRCHQPLAQKKGIVRRRLRKIFRGCEVCGRKFWFGNIDQVERIGEAMVWLDQKGGVPIDQPRRERVSQICLECREKASALEAEYQQQLQRELEAARQQSAHVYQEWLSRAPYVTTWFQDGLEMFSFDEALEHFVHAAVYPMHKLGIEEKPAFYFREFFGRQAESFSVQPPSGYENVLVKRVRSGIGQTRLYGTVRRFEGDKIGIYWVIDREQ
jgi:hypothetical protein